MVYNSHRRQRTTTTLCLWLLIIGSYHHHHHHVEGSAVSLWPRRRDPSQVIHNNKGRHLILPTTTHTMHFPGPGGSSLPQEEDMEKKKKKDLTLSSRFLRSLWKGITLPFPALRSAILDEDDHHDNSARVISLTALVGYLGVGTAAYTFLEPTWSIVDAAYFTVTCFTTVGFGDIVPSSGVSKAFTSVWGVVGVLFVGAAVATLSDSFVARQAAVLAKARRVSRRKFMEVFDRDHDGEIDVTKHFLAKFRQQSKKDQDDHYQQVRESTLKKHGTMMNKTMGLLQSSLPSLLLIFGGGVGIHMLNGGKGPLTDALYYAIITASTIGLGDISPMTPVARAAAVIYIPLAVAAAGELLSNTASAVLEYRQHKRQKEELEQMLTISRLGEMDKDASGRIDRHEFLRFMLLELHLVEEDDIERIHQQFDRLDRDESGYLEKSDLALMAKYKGVPVVSKKQTKSSK